MDFRAVIAFLVIYYLRPQEWIDALAFLRPVMIIFIFGILAMVMRKRGFNPKDLFKTPHDWVMLAYLLWLCVSTASNGGNWRNIPGLVIGTIVMLWAIKNLMGFYYVVVQALHTRERLEKFLWWWLGMILMVALLALASEYGFDPMGSYARTHGPMKGRLVLNNEIFGNPNELGHAVVPLLPLIYLLCIWKRSPFVKQIAACVMFIPLYCVYLTKSKGSYLSGAFTAMVAVVFGRPRVVQVAIVVLALTAGYGAMKMLPRMGTMRDPRSEEGIQGRLAVFYFGYDSFKHNRLLGWRNFAKSFAQTYNVQPKASHSAYNQIGAELGPIGLFLYLAAYYCCLRSLVTAKTRTLQEERIRRVLVAAFAGFMISSWVIDLAYHGTFFVLMACGAAFHRIMLKTEDEERVEEQLDDEARRLTGIVPPQPEVPAHAQRTAFYIPPPEHEQKEEEDETPYAEPGIQWNRFGLADLLICSGILFAVFRFWKFIIFSWGT